MTETEIEADIRAVLARQAELLTPPSIEPSDLDAAVVRLDFRGQTDVPRRGRWAWAAAAAVIVVAGVGGGMAVMDRGAERADMVGTLSEPPPGTSDGYLFHTPNVRLDAGEVTVAAAGQTFTPSAGVEVSGDPGTTAYTTLELKWLEHDVPMRIYMYFTSDGSDWWANEIRTYDGAEKGEWVTMRGEFFRSPLGQPFIGDLDLDHLRLNGLELEAFTISDVCIDPELPIAIAVNQYAINASSGPGSGYATGFKVIDTATCQTIDGNGLSILVTSTDPALVAVVEPKPDLSRTSDGIIRIELDLLGAGEASIHIEASDSESGDLIDTADISVTVQ